MSPQTKKRRKESIKKLDVNWPSFFIKRVCTLEPKTMNSNYLSIRISKVVV
jgi:hypothetical protein